MIDPAPPKSPRTTPRDRVPLSPALGRGAKAKIERKRAAATAAAAVSHRKDDLAILLAIMGLVAELGPETRRHLAAIFFRAAPP